MESGFASYPQVNFEELIENLKREFPRLPRQEAKLAQFMLLNLNTLGLETGRSLAQKVGVSEVTVGRLLRRLGCNGMKELKSLLRKRYSVSDGLLIRQGGVSENWKGPLEAEVAAVTSVFNQTLSEEWSQAVSILHQTNRIYVTGFQSVRGLAEDFSRRLALARPNVQYLSPRDGMLGEWLMSDQEEIAISDSCLILVDVVPYAKEAEKLARLAHEQGRGSIVVSDEYCHWSGEITDSTIYAPSNTGLFLESTVGITVALGLLVDAVAAKSPEMARKRLTEWKRYARRLEIF